MKGTYTPIFQNVRDYFKDKGIEVSINIISDIARAIEASNTDFLLTSSRADEKRLLEDSIAGS